MEPDEPVPTPPVVDSDLSAKFMGEWDGVDRRRTDPLAKAIEQAVGNVKSNTNNVSDVKELMKYIIMGILVALAFVTCIGMFTVSHNQTRAEKNQEKFRTSLTCFVVGLFDNGQTPDRNILTRCGFIKAPE